MKPKVMVMHILTLEIRSMSSDSWSANKRMAAQSFAIKTKLSVNIHIENIMESFVFIFDL